MPLPTEHEIRDIAKKHGYFERKEEKSRTLFFERWKSRSEDRACPDLINVFYTTQGIMTKIKHPRGGYNQLWRSDAYNSSKSLEAIFKNPRIHTGRGYRRAENCLRGCATCGLQKEAFEYSYNQFRKGSGFSNCTACVKQKNQQKNPRTTNRALGASEKNVRNSRTSSVLAETIRRIDPEHVTPYDGAGWPDHEFNHFRKTLGDALAEQRCRLYDGGYSWLVDTPETYSIRIGRFVPADQMPKAPRNPILTPKITSTIELYDTYCEDTAEYIEYCGWNKAALEALQQRYPDYPLDADHTIREALDYISDIAESQVAAWDYLIGVFNCHEYKPSLDGPGQFFENMLYEKQNLELLVMCSEKTYGSLILVCLEAIRRCELPRSDLKKIEQEWAREAHPPEGPGLWRAFTDFYTPRIRVLEVKQAMCVLIAKSNPAAVWRQWRFWCFSCGCNLNHNSDSCTRPKRKHSSSATFNLPFGGNQRKDHLYLKWCHPYTNRPYDEPFLISS